MVNDIIRYIDMFSGIGGFREGLTRAGGFACAGHCEIDSAADRSYCALFGTSGEWFCADAREADPAAMPHFDLLCGGFPCQSFNIAGRRGGFGDPRVTLFFELARLVKARHPRYLLFDPKIQYTQNRITEYWIFDGTGRREATPARAACVLAALADNGYQNVPGLLNHDGGRTFAAILHTLDGLGYGVEWQVLDSKDFGVPQARRRVYIVGYLDGRCAGKIFPVTETAGTPLVQVQAGAQGERVCSSSGVSCTLSAGTGGFGGRTGLYDLSGIPIKEATKKGYKLAYPGDSIELSHATTNTRRGRVGHGIAHTLTSGCTQGTLEVCPVRNPIVCAPERNPGRTRKPGAPMFTLTTKDRHGVLTGGRVRRLTPRECLRLQGWQDDRIDKVLAIQSDNQAYKQAGNGVTVMVVEAIGRRIAAADAELRGVRDGA